MSIQRINDPVVREYAPAIGRMRRDVVEGLSQSPKRLPSQYLYDARGARLFEQICDLPEYYLTRCEMTILRTCGDDVADRIGPAALIVEPGSGSGDKTRLLLQRLHSPVAYVPIDISRRQLAAVAAELNADFPELEVLPVCADFMGPFEIPATRRPPRHRMVFFPGSTIGNLVPEEAIRLLCRMSDAVGPGGAALVGVDLKKDRRILEPAYDDSAGVSAAFALNYLDRLNNELDADFDREQFGYGAHYHERAGRIEMYIVSRCDQRVRVADQSFDLRADERIYTEFSYKYSPAEFARLASQAGYEAEHVWTDPDGLFSVHYMIA